LAESDRERIQPVAEKAVIAAFCVIPAKAGIQSFPALLDSCLRGSNGRILFFSNLLADKS
jgi:hypothetical protein